MNASYQLTTNVMHGQVVQQDTPMNQLDSCIIFFFVEETN